MLPVKDLQAPAFAALLFIVVASPTVFKFVDSLASPVGVKVAVNGVPTRMGLLVHAAVFFGLTYTFLKSK